MQIRDIRRKTGLTQKAFAERYHIPLQSLKQWESLPGSASCRKPPEYISFILDRLVSFEFDVSFGPLDRVQSLGIAARHSRGCLKQWLRYLGKELEGHKKPLTTEQINAVIRCNDLDMVQKEVFRRAVTKGTATNRYAASLGKKADTPMTDILLKRRH